jgi:hypothetical protein
MQCRLSLASLVKYLKAVSCFPVMYLKAASCFPIMYLKAASCLSLGN